MEAVRNYLISVVAVCMISVPPVVMVKNPTMNRIVRLAGGVLILLVALRPLLGLDMKDVSGKLEGILEEYQLDTSFLRQNQMGDYVKNAAEDYIEGQAREMGGEIQAEVQVSQDELPVPVHVKLIGTMRVEQMEKLGAMLSEDLNIPPEEQEWRLYGTGE